ncbi:GNAT family N-acetyltransferase [Humibacter ginsenosidimutans]|uniref:GNAT family N-acetyltransferase n=1 Tax=Humibacter ginsenosidimutans TaxID=2599293 RepID=A0A5B8M764_9MICO|nr:GNAT family N-acetyltransferase [Humibacter ginsenosidimutans]QDZ16377.1 GNAT family N-acetyltransferase [Humibacter ginsenosidimutans]
MDPVELRTERLVLNQPTGDDLARVVEYCRDPLFEHYMTLPWPYQEKDAVFFVERLVPDGWRTEREYTWALREASTGPLLGVVGMRVQPEPRTVDVGYWLGGPHRGHGHMTKATRAAVSWAFDSGRCDTVLWECVAGNRASARVARSAGFSFTGAGTGRVTLRDGSQPDAWLGARHRGGDEELARSTWPESTIGADA